MASTVKSSALKVTLTERIVLNGRDHGSSNELTINDINEASKRITTVTTSKHELMSFSGTMGKGNYILADMRYIDLLSVFYNYLSVCLLVVIYL